MNRSESAYRLQPLTDVRWNEFLQIHPLATVFHTTGWLEALRRTYGYQPLAFTTCPPDTTLLNAAVFCNIDSWLTGRRLVSLPFTDQCDLLLNSPSDFAAISMALQIEVKNLRYVEIRSTETSIPSGFQLAHSFCLHQLNLTPSLSALFDALHRDSIQRKIMRANRECLAYEEGRSPRLLEQFYELLILTRRRHLLPPQPKKWFENLIECLGEALKIRIAFRNKQPIAAVLTLHYKDTLTYKYGCSDSRWHNLGAMPFLLWRSVADAKQAGLSVFDFGRSEWSNAGLIRFKDRLGARRSVINCLRTGSPKQSAGLPLHPGNGWRGRMAGRVLSHLPDRVLRVLGNLTYRHFG